MCETCQYYDTDRQDQPCCGCVNECNYEKKRGAGGMTFEDVKRIRENPSAEDCDNKELAKLIDVALEKQIPRKPIWDMGWVCPNCKNYEIQHFEKRPDWNDLFCSKCGQALDWSETND